MTSLRETVEANDRRNRVLSVSCPHCDAPTGETCVNPSGNHPPVQHAARWDAWYAEHPS